MTQPSETRRAWALTAVLSAAAVLLCWPVAHGASRAASVGVAPFLALVLGFAAAEGCVAHIAVGRQAHSFAFSEIPFVVGLFVFSPAQVVAARLLGTALALVVVRRQQAVKLAFNLAQYALGSLVGVVIWQALGGPRASTDRAAVAALAATLAMSALSALALHAVLRLVGASPRWGASARAIVTGLTTAAANTSLGLVAVTVADRSWTLLWAVAVLGAFLALAQRSHVQLQRRHDLLQRLNRVSRGLGHDLHAGAVVDEVLGGALDVLDGVAAEVELTGDDEHAATVLRYDGRATRTVVRPEAESGAEVATRRSRPRRSRSARVSAPLVAHGRVIGRLSVDANPNLRGFGADEEHLLDALAQQASIALANGQLADSLRREVAENEHRATHDPLTGLANRVMFERETTALLASGHPAAVLLFDLDRFKEVNDTLGHAAGDALLQDAGARLRVAIPQAVCVARLGGDEFTVLLATGDADVAAAAAQTARRELLRPLDVCSVPVSVDASVGVAVAPQHGRECADLLRKADVAMYVAKNGRGAVQVYHAGIDHNDASRLSLVADLRDAIDNDMLTVVYQPKVDLTGATPSCTVEALVRWTDPVRGFVSPDAFIPVAEQTGVILALTDYVLETAIRQCRTWLDEGIDTSVAVNLSPSVLRDGTFIDRLVRMLTRHRMPPSRLTLELTENAVMTDVAQTIEMLWGLRRAGVRLAIDDLGVGQSSLAYLKQLPVHEVKIDKSFVMTMTDDPADDAIVCAMTGLAHRLGLSVVAEGVETRLTRDRLVEIGCDTAQGFWYSRPVPAAEIRPYLTAEREPTVAPLLSIVG